MPASQGCFRRNEKERLKPLAQMGTPAWAIITPRWSVWGGFDSAWTEGSLVCVGCGVLAVRGSSHSLHLLRKQRCGRQPRCPAPRSDANHGGKEKEAVAAVFFLSCLFNVCGHHPGMAPGNWGTLRT